MAFLEQLAAEVGPVGIQLLVAMLRRPMEPVLAKRGVCWEEIEPALRLVDSCGRAEGCCV